MLSDENVVSDSECLNNAVPSDDHVLSDRDEGRITTTPHLLSFKPLLSVSRLVDDFGGGPDVHVFFKQRILTNDHHTEIGVEAHSALDDVLNRLPPM